MWPRRVYSRKKRGGQKLNLTPTPDLCSAGKAKTPPAPGSRLTCCLKREGKAPGLPKISEKLERNGRGGSDSGPLSTQLSTMEEKNLEENSTNEETQDEKTAPSSESVTDLQVHSSSSSELVSGLSLQHDISSSLLSYSITDPYTGYKSSEESLSSFPSPELFRGSDYLDWECLNLKDHMQWKNSTLLDTSKAVTIEKAPQFSNLSAILNTSSEDYQKFHKKKGMTLSDHSISPKPKCTSNSESDNATCEVLLAKKTCPATSEKTKKKPEKASERRDTTFQTKLNSHLNIKAPSSYHRSALENNADRSVTNIFLPQPMKPALKTHSGIPGKKNRGLLTSTPFSETADFVVSISIYSNPISIFLGFNYITGKQFLPSNTSEICCIIRASPGTRPVKSKGVTVKKKKYSPPKDTPQGRMCNYSVEFWNML
ncbi:meiosis-specific kinetochore protein [Otolemur garnettii]|uniref:meiosis-specific kinetochore protein n=1 Tax=Otolemur garnettii TaxID=30611 RepID=UPI000C7EE147|nr:meiosis-specific kinetochore protein [Otolemur garnettii]